MTGPRGACRLRDLVAGEGPQAIDPARQMERARKITAALHQLRGIDIA
jgi:hypothetical protein